MFLRVLLLVFALAPFMAACSVSTQEPSLTLTATFQPTATLTWTPAPTQTSIPSPTVKPSSTPSPTLTPIIVSHPRLKDLESQGYTQEIFSGFSIMTITGGTLFGGPDKSTQASQLVVVMDSGNTYVYMQYASKETGNCHLLFFLLNPGEEKLLADIDVSELNNRIVTLWVSAIDNSVEPALTCSPYGWSDINRNGKPDMPVTLIWANRYTGSELHLFEVVDHTTVADLTKDLPGIMSPWDFDPSRTNQTVIDLAWADHDCIYPPIYVFWVYDWRDGEYVDVTPELDFSEYIASLKSEIIPNYGSPFNTFRGIGPLTQLLLIYDRTGQRDKGWQEYKELTDPSHWPSTSAEDLKWLQSDVDHFAKQHETGRPFTPNNYCDEPP